MTEEEKQQKLNYLMSYTPKVMPANPTAQGWTESQIRLYQYKGFEILFSYLLHFYDYIDQERYRAIHAEQHLDDRVTALELKVGNTLSAFDTGKGLLKENNTLKLDFSVVQPKISVGNVDPAEKAEYEGEIYINLRSGELFRSDASLSWVRIGDICKGLQVYFREENDSMTIEFKEER